MATCGVLTVSDSRTRETDTGGQLISKELEAAGHAVVVRDIVPDDPAEIDGLLRRWLDRDDLQVVLTTGGTGISSRDTTIEVVASLLDKQLTGFGELFRMLSFEQVGSAAMLSRALAGLSGETFLFAMPGSPKAVGLALHRLILPELPHLLWERSR
ncbi:MAG: MogA/MoaB family molybdenum cofactor biosynthesis protein [Deltaproteobacteria bacterium]|nr:MogA/MoaB family molybdenum cofactor biosynthesis protein [Deltaproteobacteria bacterium]